MYDDGREVSEESRVWEVPQMGRGGEEGECEVGTVVIACRKTEGVRGGIEVKRGGGGRRGVRRVA